ncbi:uncharacterized protein LAJ45_11613 [Morchella importuna]|uniref:uncharacterized protein n=1 Tax=Morchella importuna TaxID=1174673 RepID=UPI001E8CCC29|nr:uncharacterized protein LAJ45_11613 [Morchella importuna]KAH8144413.1 hypothetical protein LAJ45_11613 [Morchella importuna]
MPFPPRRNTQLIMTLNSRIYLKRCISVLLGSVRGQPGRNSRRAGGAWRERAKRALKIGIRTMGLYDCAYIYIYTRVELAFPQLININIPK